MSIVESPVYCRKLDRSPENAAFSSLSKESKALVYQLRSAVEVAKDKVWKLRDENEDRERDLGRERALRKAAEARLENLVDMYGDPAVNEELRARLPRAGKLDPKNRLLDDLNDENLNPEDRKKRDLSDEDLPQSARKGAKMKGGRGKKKGVHRISNSDGEGTDEEDGRNPYPGMYPCFGGPVYPVPMFAYPPPMVYGPQAGAGASPGMPSAQSTPYMYSGAMPSPSSHNRHGTSGDLPSAYKGPEKDSGGASGSLRDTMVIREQNKQIAKLLAELDAANELNKKLQEKLARTEQELESLKIAQKSNELEIEARASGRITELVEEIYRAQKQRDESMMGRIQLANEERDQALQRLKRLEQGLAEMEAAEKTASGYNDSIADIPVLNNERAATLINQHGDAILNSLHSARERQQRIATEEIRAVLEERDQAVARCKKLESELLRLQRQNRARGPDQSEQQLLQAKLLATEQERDLAVQRAKKLDEELQTLRVYYSLHKSLSQESNLRDQYNNTLESLEGELKHRDGLVDWASKESNQLMAQYRAVVVEKNQLQAQLDKALVAEQDASNNCQKLERLVNVLRRKISGMGGEM